MRIEINEAGESRAHLKHWQFCVGSCHAPMALRKDYIEQLKFVREELGIERVRFHGVFNDDMKVGMNLRPVVPLKRAEKFKQFSFFQIARAYDNILSTGVKPLVELGFMPSLLASGGRKCTFSYKGNVTMPESLDEWKKFIVDFIKFLIDRYGADEIESWFFEVWNEPNLPVFFAGSKRDYFKLYAATSEAVKSVDPKIRIGGPVTANNAWVPEFLEYCASVGAAVDFVSTHAYPNDPCGHSLNVGKMAKEILGNLRRLRKSSGGGVLDGARIMFPDKSNTQKMDRDMFRDKAAVVKKQAGGLPVYYTEWCVSSTCTAPVNDSVRAATYIVRTVLQLEGTVEGSSYWTFSDLFEELLFFPQPFSGAFGMLNVYGIPKPSFWAFKLLSMLGGERLNQECFGQDVEYCAFKKDNKLQVLLFRQNFKDIKSPDVPIELHIRTDKTPIAAIATQIDEDHGNPERIWREMGSPELLKPEDVDFIKQKSVLGCEALSFSTIDGEVILTAALGMNQVKLIEIEWKAE